MKFAKWLEGHIKEIKENEEVHQDMCFLSRGPDYQVKSYKGYVSNGVKFQLSELSNHRLTQNNGVFLYAISTDSLSIINVAYHGLLENIYELTCHHSMKIPLFECK